MLHISQQCLCSECVVSEYLRDVIAKQHYVHDALRTEPALCPAFGWTFGAAFWWTRGTPRWQCTHWTRWTRWTCQSRTRWTCNCRTRGTRNIRTPIGYAPSSWPPHVTVPPPRFRLWFLLHFLLYELIPSQSVNAQLDLMHALQLLQIRIVSLDTHRLTLLTTHNTTTLSLTIC